MQSLKKIHAWAQMQDPLLCNLFKREQDYLLSSQNQYIKYGKCSKILNTFLFLFSAKILIIRAGIYKLANRELE